MKLRKLGTMLAAVASMACGASYADNANNADIWLFNKTGYSIRELYISPARENQWGSERLRETAILENGTSRFLRFDDRVSCMKDIKAIFANDGSEAVWKGIDLCAIDKLTLKYDRATKKVSALKQ